MTTNVARIALLGAISITAVACDGFSTAVTSHTDILARAAGHELAVDDAASMIAPHTRIPAQTQVVDAVANLWVDYTLLATAAAQDSTLSNVDVDLYIRPIMQNQLVWKLREKVIQVDSVISDEELRAEYEREQPNMEVRARHILLKVPAEATPAQRDSVMSQIRGIRDRALAGEDFAALARQYGQDGTAAGGGDLGFFGKEDMLAPFSEMAFATEPGRISDVVETIHGFHVIKVEERKVTPFEEVKDAYRAQVQQNRVQAAEADYIKNLTEPLGIEVQEGAVENAKEMAAKPAMNLRGRAASRALVRYKGGALTAAEFLNVIRTWDPSQRGQMGIAQDDQIKQVLEGLARNQIFIEEAERQGLSVNRAEEDSARVQVQAQLAMAARASGLTSIQPQDGETMHQAVERKVRGFLEAIMRGEQSVIPLGPISFSLREQYRGEVFDRSFEPVVTKTEGLRTAAAPPPVTPPATLPTPPDSGAASGR